MKILIINGVNLSSLGSREIDIYGSVSFDDYFETLKEKFPEVELSYFCSDEVGELCLKITSSRDFDGIILNAGAYTHTSIALADAVKATKTPVVEVHVSNLFARENYRRNSQLAGACVGFVSGFGLQSYDLAIFSFLTKNRNNVKLFRI